MNIITLFKQKYETQKIALEKFKAANDTTSFDYRLATWFGAGHIVPAPGTWGTVGGVIFGVPLLLLTNPIIVLLTAGILYYMGQKSIENLEQKTGLHDPSFIVIDEVAAILVGIALIPDSYFTLNLIILFSFFRYFDAKKPWLIGLADKSIKGAKGVMIDDMIAVFFAIISWWLLIFISVFIIGPMV